MKLTHVGISNFRSIGEDFVTIDLSKKINVLVGANNCGKSNVMKALVGFGDSHRAEVDAPNRNKDRLPSYKISVSTTSDDSVSLQTTPTFSLVARSHMASQTVTQSTLKFKKWRDLEPLWREFTSPDYSYPGDPNREEFQKETQKLTQALWDNVTQKLPPRTLIPEFREITEDVQYAIKGNGIVRLLAAWQHPPIGEDSNLSKFRSVRRLLRQLLELPEADLEVVNGNTEIIVSNHDFRLPLKSYGTGIHELIILATAVVSYENALICIEEPEIHFHPLLQRRFLEFLRSDATTNRYVITTHSPALIAPNSDTAVTHLWLENGVTKSRLIETTEHSLGALHDLGAKASDILQANSVIWVEGPSDRIYLRHWLQLLYPDQFREGIDYSIMFYGGRLLSHVSLAREDAEPEDDTEDADDLVQLLRINQHSAILIDSDRRKSTDPINATKQRVQEQCAASNVLCWITDGREIENYLPTAVLNATYGELSACTPEIKLRPFGLIEEALEKSLKKSWPRSNYYDQAKPKMARLISAQTTKDHLTPEIIGWMEKLIRVIRHDPP